LKSKIFILIILFTRFIGTKAQQTDSADFCWGNAFYYNIEEGEPIHFNGIEVKLLKVINHYNQLKIGEDTLWMKVARRSVPKESGGIRVFVADNKNVKALAPNEQVHGLLSKDALICLSDFRKPLLDPDQYIFPVSFNDGYLWNMEEESYLFSYYNSDETGRSPLYRSYEGVGLDIHDDRGKRKHWLIAVENSQVVWVEPVEQSDPESEAGVLLESESQPGIYYYYSKLNNRSLAVKKGQMLVRGEVIGTARGDDLWCHAQFTILKAETEPVGSGCFHNAINGFPQLFSLYSPHGEYAGRSFSRGRITFGKPRWLGGNQKNTMAFEPYSGKGWRLGNWCTADKVEWVSNSSNGNARLRKVMYEGTSAQCINPSDHFEYQISVQNGTYRIRAKVGDLYLPSWQKIEFNELPVTVKSLDAGQSEWTGERILEIHDGTIVVRIYTDKENELVAGLEEIVFQRAY
jgi:hypothetical protein